MNNSGIDLNNNLRIINKLVFQLKVSFNLESTKQAQQMVFSCKTIKANNPLLFFNGNPVVQIDIQKHLGMLLDTNMSFLNHLKVVFEQTSKTVGLLCKLQMVLAMSFLLCSITALAITGVIRSCSKENLYQN